MKRKKLLLFICLFSLLFCTTPCMGEEIKNAQEGNIGYKLYAGVPIVSVSSLNNSIPPIINSAWEEGWTSENINIRSSPSVNSNILSVIDFNTKIEYKNYDENWLKVREIGEDGGFIFGYAAARYISDEECSSVSFVIPKNNGFKSYMSYKTITDKSSLQYKLQNNYAYTGNYGIRQVNERYCVAVGTAFNTQVGTYFDLILKNGHVIKCIVGDIKADAHTEINNIVTEHNGCVSEFIVETSSLPYSVFNYNNTGSGDVSSCLKEWESPVEVIKIYNKNIF